MEVLKRIKSRTKSLFHKARLNSLELTSLEYLKIVTFWRIVGSNNVYELDANYSKNKKYSDIELALLSSHWVKLYDEFYEHRNNKSGKYLLNKNSEIAELTLKLELLSDIENRLILLINMSGVKDLRKFVSVRTIQVVADFKILYPKVKVNQFDSCIELLTVIQSVIKSQTNIFDEKLGSKEKAVTKQRETVYDVVAIMSKILGYNLDVNNMTCLEFIGHENLINSTGKQNSKK